MDNLIRHMRKAIQAGVPLVSINTEDQFDVLRRLRTLFDDYKHIEAVVSWDAMNGYMGVSKKGKDLITKIRTQLEVEPEERLGPDGPFAIMIANRYIPSNTIVIMFNAQLYVSSGGVGNNIDDADRVIIQGLCNIREAYKDFRMFIMLGNGITFPPVLNMDVFQLNDALPEESEIAEMAKKQYGRASESAKKQNINFEELDDVKMENVVSSTKGMSKFSAEQTLCLSIDVESKGINVEDLRARNNAIINNTRGLSVVKYDVAGDDIAGLENLLGYLRMLMNGPDKPRAIAFMDEIEKTSIANAGGATGAGNDIGRDALRQVLMYCEDNRVPGTILIGPAGVGKSLCAKVIGNEYQIPTFKVDINDTEGSLVGESEQNMRKMINVIDSVSGGRPLFIATCNSISVMPPELRRRFYLGTFFVDLPNKEEKAAMWKLYMKKFNFKKQDLPDDANWTGSDIYVCFDIARRFECSLIKASSFVVPCAVSSMDQVERLRRECSGKYLSANYPGRYMYKKEEAIKDSYLNEDSERNFVMNQ